MGRAPKKTASIITFVPHRRWKHVLFGRNDAMICSRTIPRELSVYQDESKQGAEKPVVKNVAHERRAFVVEAFCPVAVRGSAGSHGRRSLLFAAALWLIVFLHLRFQDLRLFQMRSSWYGRFHRPFPCN
ncbi:unnamed protein product [Linum tenue]|uniref:Transmembrane protein n=1 Tax=Linum tenue TaxID=586396 RepID=A0AAV0LJN6_9ROSI|nr:unnamed protein product [Linum tenue]